MDFNSCTRTYTGVSLIFSSHAWSYMQEINPNTQIYLMVLSYFLFQLLSELLIGGKYPSYFTNITGSTNYFNILLSTVSASLMVSIIVFMLGFKKNPEELSYYEAFIEKAEVRNEIHVGNLTFNNGSTSKKYLIPVKRWALFGMIKLSSIQM